MQPLSATVRRAYLALFIALFCVLLPVVIFYADGWRWKRDTGFYKTGGIFVSVPYQDALVTLDGEPIGRSGYLNRSFYVDNLGPGAYVVQVEREGYLPWNRTLVVEPQIVTDSDALLIPKRLEPKRLAPVGATTTGATLISRSQYDSYVIAFATTTAERLLQSPLATTTPPQDESSGIELIVEGGDVFVRWLSADAFPPSRFCVRPSLCTRELFIEQGAAEVTTARFFRGGVVYATDDGVYFSEMDVRPSSTWVKLFDAVDPDIRIINDALIIKTADALYEISL